VRVARASRYSESLKVVVEVFDERPIVFPGVGEEDFWPPWLLIGANNLSRQFDSITLQTQTPLASTIHRCWTQIGVGKSPYHKQCWFRDTQHPDKISAEEAKPRIRSTPL